MGTGRNSCHCQQLFSSSVVWANLAWAKMDQNGLMSANRTGRILEGAAWHAVATENRDWPGHAFLPGAPARCPPGGTFKSEHWSKPWKIMKGLEQVSQSGLMGSGKSGGRRGKGGHNTIARATSIKRSHEQETKTPKQNSTGAPGTETKWDKYSLKQLDSRWIDRWMGK